VLPTALSGPGTADFMPLLLALAEGNAGWFDSKRKPGR
jgi:hypothetical protein